MIQTREQFLPFSLPLIGEEEIAEVVDSLRSGWITTGPKVRRFEEDFARYIGARHAIAVNSCTAGLHIALAALGVAPGDEVIVPTLTFCSTANVVVHLGARPVLVDAGEDLNVAPEAIAAAITPRTKAIVPVHYGGQPCDLEVIYALAAQHGLPVVEDAAHAVGAGYHGLKIGCDALTAGQAVTRITAFSFYPTKNMTTGEGGMVTTSDDALAERMRLLTLHGMSRDAWKRYTSAGSWYYEVVAAGFKYNMTDIQAALGIHQLRRLDGFVAVRQRYARLYDEALAALPQVETPIVHGDRSHIYHLYPIRLVPERLAIDRARFIEELRALNIGSSVHFIPVHLHPFYRDTFGYKRGDLPVAERIYERIISLPLFPKMVEQDVRDVIAAVADVAHTYRRSDEQAGLCAPTRSEVLA
ncbi:MAG TPA: DegT/DnrJ/EryC1/StrS family aminotransferase [Anaerolineae bacterium]|nr:DegT/DnrJ/EryC1/StrS family aminotransferase [Anaerolineae bacterium]HOR00750.1 DegT/DnrJ/EryC1/StrS family aminotransferase [Anaerolineae bacterium]